MMMMARPRQLLMERATLYRQHLATAVSLIYFCLQMILQKVMLRIIFMVPSKKQAILNEIASKTHMDISQLKKEDWQDTIFTWASMKSNIKMFILDLYKTVVEGGAPYNANLLTLENEKCRLLDFVQGDRPLVLNFGSCTCPPFMGKFDEVCQIASDYAPVADFLTIYIEEAHPSDGWAFNNNISIRQHRCIEDRLAAAKMLQTRNPPFQIVADTLDNNANMAYGGLYERLFIIHKGKIAYEGGRGPELYFPSEVRTWLETNVNVPDLHTPKKSR